MAKEIEVKADPREVSGTSASRRLRRAGQMPAVLATLDGVTSRIQMNQHDFQEMLHHHQSESLLVDLAVGTAASIKVLLTEVQHDPLSGNALHADFKEVSMTETLSVSVSISLKGEPIGVSQDGGMLEQVQHAIDVECLASDMVEELVVDVSALLIGDSLRVADVTIPSGLTVVTPADAVVATVLAPRVEEEPVAAEGEEGEEGEKGVEGEAGEAAEGAAEAAGGAEEDES